MLDNYLTMECLERCRLLFYSLCQNILKTLEMNRDNQHIEILMSRFHYNKSKTAQKNEQNLIALTFF